jgi:hypothetical protein
LNWLNENTPFFGCNQWYECCKTTLQVCEFVTRIGSAAKKFDATKHSQVLSVIKQLMKKQAR